MRGTNLSTQKKNVQPAPGRREKPLLSTFKPAPERSPRHAVEAGAAKKQAHCSGRHRGNGHMYYYAKSGKNGWRAYRGVVGWMGYYRRYGIRPLHEHRREEHTAWVPEMGRSVRAQSNCAEIVAPVLKTRGPKPGAGSATQPCAAVPDAGTSCISLKTSSKSAGRENAATEGAAVQGGNADERAFTSHNGLHFAEVVYTRTVPVSAESTATETAPLRHESAHTRRTKTFRGTSHRPSGMAHGKKHSPSTRIFTNSDCGPASQGAAASVIICDNTPPMTGIVAAAAAGPDYEPDFQPQPIAAVRQDAGADAAVSRPPVVTCFKPARIAAAQIPFAGMMPLLDTVPAQASAPALRSGASRHDGKVYIAPTIRRKGIVKLVVGAEAVPDE